MPRGTIIVDGLWYCLCPSFGAFNSRLSFGRPFQTHTRSSLIKLLAAPKRLVHNGSEPPQVGDETSHRPRSEPVTTESKIKKHPVASVKDLRADGYRSKRVRVSGRYANTPQTEPARAPDYFEGKDTSTLENLLLAVSLRPHSLQQTTAILRILIRDRHVRPDVRHYRALILANTDPEYGSSEHVRSLLDEMEENDITADSGTLHAALQALSVHPDFLLRQHVLRKFRDIWISLSPAGWHAIVAGLIRERQFELALDHLEHMERKGIVIQNWLHSLLIYNLCEVEELDQVLRLMKLRVDQGDEISMSLWLYVLDEASSVLHHGLTRFVWKYMVDLAYLFPSHGMCENTLTVASRTGDTELAVSVAKFLEKTNVPMFLETYEKIVETYVMAGDLFAAFDTLCAMQRYGINLEESSTRSILTYMLQNKVPPRDAWAMLKRLKSLDVAVPVGCANVIIEVCERALEYCPSALDDATAFYKELYDVCSSPADVETYNNLISVCRKARNAEVCTFIVSEMAALNVIPNATTFERLILLCLDLGNFNSAFLYFQDLRARGERVSDETCEEIRRLCDDSTDKFAVQLKNHPLIRDDLLRRHLLEHDTNRSSQFAGGSSKRPGTIIERRIRTAALRVQLTPRQWALRKQAIRRASKERRKRKRRRKAMANAQEEDDWENYEPSGISPKLEKGKPTE